MARLSNVSAAAYGSGSGSGRAPDPASIELTQLLSRLQQSVFHPTPERERRLRTSEYERARVESNLGYARTVLTKLEHEAQANKLPGRRVDTPGVFDVQRDMLETIADRLEDLRKMAAHDEEDDDSSDGEDLLGDIIPTPSESMDSRSADAREEDSSEEVVAASPAPQPTTPAGDQISPESSSSLHRDPPTVNTELTTQTSQTLRGRNSASSPSPTPSASAHTTARAALFANRRKPAPPQTSTATAEAILDHQRGEQDALSDSILKMAGALKANSQRFSITLEEDKEVVGRAGDSMGKTERGMEAARGRMGALKRMTEGKGWWGRMILYAWVYGLMVGLVLLVFVIPKLRF